MGDHRLPKVDEKVGGRGAAYAGGQRERMDALCGR